LFTGYYLLTHNSESDFDSNEDLLKDGDVSEQIVYETEVDSVDDCSSFEKYDELRKVCSYECNTESECTDIQNEIDKELDSWAEELEKDTEPVQEKFIREDDKSLKGEYSVDDDEKITLKSGDDKEEFRKIWGEISELSPGWLSQKYIEEYQVFDNAKDDTLAFVDDEDGNGKWRVAVNLYGYKTSTEKENKSTFIHELGHIISLNLSQVAPNIPKESCKNFFLDEGCTYPNSYLNIFKNRFWSGSSSQDFDETRFVTEYASTNEVEDLAESFAFFVLSDSKSVVGEEEKNKKVKSFYDHSELVRVREGMRSSLSKDILRAKKKIN
jgi:hypothetical protein